MESDFIVPAEPKVRRMKDSITGNDPKDFISQGRPNPKISYLKVAQSRNEIADIPTIKLSNQRDSYPVTGLEFTEISSLKKAVSVDNFPASIHYSLFFSPKKRTEIFFLYF